MLVRARRPLSVAELHDALGDECDRRTVYRDLDQLCQAGFPLVDTKGRWRVLDAAESGWAVPLDPTELMALALAEDLLAGSGGAWVLEPLQALRGKLEAMLTPRGREYFALLRASTLATAFGAPDYDDRGGVLVALNEAIQRRQVVRIGHTSPGRPRAERDVAPYKLWLHQNVFYLIGYCRLRSDIRQFAVERIDTAELLDERFTPDPDFDVEAFVGQGFGAYHGAVADVVIDVSASLAPLVRARRFHPTQEVTDLPGGGGAPHHARRRPVHDRGVDRRLRRAGPPRRPARAGRGGASPAPKRPGGPRQRHRRRR
jgi:proteasome accessory factor B